MSAEVDFPTMPVADAGGSPRPRRLSWTRGAALAAAAVLVGLLSGDGRAVAVVNGIDPLDILNLKVRPNVIVVLDTSGSMQSTVDAASINTRSGDHPRSKMRQAKEVLQSVVQANQNKVSFLYGQYTQSTTVMGNTAAGADRFRYSTDSFQAPSMTTTELMVRGEPGQVGTGFPNRGLQSWQDIRPAWNTLYFGEGVTTTTTPPQVIVNAANNKFYFNERTNTSGSARYWACVITLGPADQRTYVGDPDMTLLANLITTKMAPAYGGADRTCNPVNGPAALPLQNTLTLTWNAGSRLFELRRAGGGRQFQVMMNGVAGPLMPSLGYTDDVPTNAQSGGGGNNWSTANGPFNAQNTLGGSTTATVICAATVTAQFYRNGTDLATALQNAMNAATGAPACSGSRSGTGTNTYGVTYNATGGSFSFSRTAGTGNFQIRWADTPNSIRGALGSPTAANTTMGTGAVTSGNSFRMLFRDNCAATCTYKFNETFDPDGTGPAATQANVVYNMRAGRLFNGETIQVAADGSICNMTFGTPTSPAKLYLEELSSCASTTPINRVTFDWAGTPFNGNNISCNGFMQKVALIPCDLDSPPAPTQFSTIFPFIDLEFNFNADGTPKGNYVESQNGAFSATSIPTEFEGGGKAEGATPIANSLIDIKPIFDTLWNTGQTGSTTSAGAPPYQLDPIKNHVDPKEKTIILFVTDGDDTCADGGSGGDDNALRAAHKAEELYTRIVSTEPASSVQTFMIGYGGAFSGGVPTRLNWIAWGGSGMTSVTGDPYSFGATGTGTARRWDAIPTPGDRAKCSTCQDAIVAPDKETLRRQLQAIIDQGASSGEFSAAGGGAAASIIESIYEYADQAPTVPGKDPFDARNPNNRFGALTPIRALATFALPGFRGQLKAYQNDGAGNAILKWSAGDKLWSSVSNGMLACPVAGNGATGGNATAGQCTFNQLTGNAEDFNISTSAAAIKRRIYTTSQNGYFGVNVDNLISTPPTAPFRVAIWPPQSASISPPVAPDDYTTQGLFDRELGLLDPAVDFVYLQTNFSACRGNNLPGACAGGGQLAAARREAREMLLAFLAGAQPDLDSNGNPLRVQGGANAGRILYKVRSWVLSEATLATSAIAGAPLQNEPELFKTEYALYRDGIRNSSGKNPDSSGVQIKQGFGLRSPDKDNTAVPGVTPNDTRTALKPVMTVVYMGANDGLHAFRGGPNCSPSGSACVETGGEELWAFVPYDQLGKLNDRYLDEPQSRANKTYMVASSIRYSDVFVPGPKTGPSIGGTTGPDILGVWRRILYVGRGIGGKYLTALDITAPGPYTERALLTTGPIPLWNRGNPDTTNGLVGGPAVNGPDTPKYATMGETWSVPAVAYVNTTTSRAAASGTNFVLYVGSGFGAAGEGTTFYTLDSLTGDVLASADVETAASSAGLSRSPSDLTYTTDDGSTASIANAIVANPVAFAPGRYVPLTSPHPAAFKTTRVYVGDLYGRFWKFLSAFPDVAIPAADLGVKQPAATAATVIGLPALPPPADNTSQKANVWVPTGNDLRRDGPFAFFGLRDDGADTDTATSGTTTLACQVAGCTTGSVVAFTPMVPILMREFDQGPIPAGAGTLPQKKFRGDIQPASAFECETVTAGQCSGAIVGRVFVGGTRLNLPNTAFAPQTPFKFGTGQYPCRSSFDSILYALGAASGQAAYDLNSVGDDAFQLFTDSRLGGVQVIADPDPARGGSQVNKEEGKLGGPVQPPPPPGIPPSSTTASANVVLAASPGHPYPAMKFGSTVCQ